MNRLAALGWIPVLVLLGCSSAQAGGNTDPRGHWVTVANLAPGNDRPASNTISKICDSNGVLIYVYYSQGGLAAVPDRPECK